MTSVVLIINSDGCLPCRDMLERRECIQREIKNTMCAARCVWVTFDKMNFSILPDALRKHIEHVPLVMYFPDGEFAKILSGIHTTNYYIMNLAELYRHGFNSYDETSITTWLRHIGTLTELKIIDTMCPNHAANSPKCAYERIVPYSDNCQCDNSGFQAPEYHCNGAAPCQNNTYHLQPTQLINKPSYDTVYYRYDSQESCQTVPEVKQEPVLTGAIGATGPTGAIIPTVPEACQAKEESHNSTKISLDSNGLFMIKTYIHGIGLTFTLDANKLLGLS